jgi:hypothetical protein
MKEFLKTWGWSILIALLILFGYLNDLVFKWIKNRALQ